MNDTLNWRADSACIGHDPALWHPTGRSQQAALEPIARRICGGCPVREECLEFALTFDAMEGEGGGHGMYGGMTGGERLALLDARRAAQAPPETPVPTCEECEAPLPVEDRPTAHVRRYCRTGGCRQKASKRRVAQRQRELDQEAALAAYAAAHGLARSLQAVAS